MFFAYAVIGSQFLGLLTNDFNQLSLGSRAPLGRVD
jgi:hypothetical protein